MSESESRDYGTSARPLVVTVFLSPPRPTPQSPPYNGSGIPTLNDGEQEPPAVRFSIREVDAYRASRKIERRRGTLAESPFKGVIRKKNGRCFRVDLCRCTINAQWSLANPASRCARVRCVRFVRFVRIDVHSRHHSRSRFPPPVLFKLGSDGHDAEALHSYVSKATPHLLTPE